MVSEFDVSNNAFTSAIPTEIGKLAEFTEGFHVSSNLLDGTLPTEFGQMSNLEKIWYISDNNIGSSIPTEFGLMSNAYEIFNFDKNSLCAPIPTELAALETRIVTFVSTSVGTPCDACDVGHYYYTDTSTRDPITNEYETSCLACKPGKYQGDGFFGGSQCADCTVGRYSGEAAEECRTCPAGSHTSDRTGSSNCTGCPAGRFLADAAVDAANHRNVSNCQLCAAGKSSTAGASECLDCAVGTIAATAGTSTCSKCAAGKYMPFIGQTACPNCASSRFSRQGATECTACQSNTAALPGSSTCDRCSANFMLDDRPWKQRQSADGGGAASSFHNTSCIECSSPDAFQCTANQTAGGEVLELGVPISRLIISPGFWRPSEWTWKDDKDDGLRACPMGTSSCKGGDSFVDGGDGYCEDGYTGPLCVLCESGWTLDSATKTCLYCEDSGRVATNPALLAFGALFVVSAALLLRRCLKAGQISLIGALESITDVAHKGTNAVAEETLDEMAEAGSTTEEGAWKRMLLNLKKTLTVKLKILLALAQIATSMGFNLGVSFPVQFTNLTSAMDGVVNLNVMSLIPLGCLHAGTNYYSTLVLMTAGPIGVVSMLMVAHYFMAEEGNTSFVSASLSLMFFVLPSSSSAILQTFKCAAFNDISTRYLESDYSIVCDIDGAMSQERTAWVFYAAIMVFIFPIGVSTYFALVFVLCFLVL